MIAVLLGGFVSGVLTAAALQEYYAGHLGWCRVWGAFAALTLAPTCVIALLWA